MSDLWDLINQGAFKKGGAENPTGRGPALSGRQKALKEKARRKEALARQKAEAEAKEAALLRKAVEEMSRWKPVAFVEIIYETTCLCGETSLFPEVFPQNLPPKPLIRFRHQDGRVWEKRIEWRNLPAGLPRETRRIPATSPSCPSCYKEREALPTNQIPLF